MNKKVCMLVKHHPFLDARIFHKEAKSLVRKGYDVTLIVPRKNGTLYDIDLKPFRDRFLEKSFVHEGVKIIAYDDKPQQLNEMYNNIFSDKSQYTNDPLVALGVAQNADIYHAHEFLSVYAGICIKRIMKKKGKNVKLIYDSHEITPDPIAKMDEKKRAVMHALLVRMLQEIDYLVTVSEGIKAWYLMQNNNLPIEVIYNSPPFLEKFKSNNVNKNSMVVCYEGIVHPNRGGLEKIIEITEICSKKIKNFKFKIIGGFKENNLLKVPDNLKNRIIQSGWVNYHSLPEYYEDVDIGWNHSDLEKSLKSMFALPNKFFSYLNNGVPVLSNKSSDRLNIIRTHHCGLVIDKNNPTSYDYAEAIFYLHQRRSELQKMSSNAKEIMKNIYSWEKMEERLFRVYERLLSNKQMYYF